MSRTGFGVMSLLLLAGGIAIAQTAGPAATARYTGELTGTNVYVRCAPVSGYPCTKLSTPDKVVVVGSSNGWLKILPPKGCYSLVAKRHIQAAGSAGTVTGDRLNVRAGSGLYPKRMDQIQLQLSKGDKVVIIGDGPKDYYKIAPPSGVTLWISGDFVKRIGPAPASPVVTPPVVAPPPVVTTPPATQPVVTKPPATQPAGPAMDDKTVVKLWEAAEKALKEQLAKPRQQRNLESVLAMYRALKPAPGKAVAALVKARIRFIKEEIEIAEDMRLVAKLVTDVQTVETKLAADKGRLQVGLPPATHKTYRAEGILSASGLFPGKADVPKRYIITNPTKRMIRAYVQCTTEAVDLDRYIGAHVGVVGSARYEKNLRMYLVEAEQVIVITPAPKPAAEPEPAAKVEPKPGPATQPVIKVEPKPASTTKPAVKVEPEVKPEPKVEPTTQPAVEPKGEPTTKPAVEAKPEPNPEPTTKPAAKEEPQPEPTTKSDPEPTTQPADSADSNEEPLPDTGLPVVEGTTTSGDVVKVNHREYD